VNSVANMKHTYSRRQFLGSTTALALGGLGVADLLAQQPPDLLLVNGRIHTMDAAARVVSQVLVRNGRFAAAGNGLPARGARRIDLTARQYALLEYFLRNPGRVLSRQMIAQHVWGLGFDAESNVIDVYVGYLHRKIDRDRERRLLHTVRGAGYVLQVEE